MLNYNKFKGLVGIGALLVPAILFGKTSATVNVQKTEAITSLQHKEDIAAQIHKGDIVEVIGLVGSSQDEAKEMQGTQGATSNQEMASTMQEAKDKDTWYEVRLESGQTGFVGQEFLTLKETDGITNTSSLNIRSYPDINNSEVIGKLYENDEVHILYKVGKFYKVYVNGSGGFVYAEYIDSPYGEFVRKVKFSDVRDVLTGDAKPESEEAISNEQGKKGQLGVKDAVVTTAMKYLGNAYVYGGTSLTKGTDCSGFTQGVMKLLGISLPRTSRQQSKVGKQVSKSQLQKGDLLFFGRSISSISHVGIYIGNGHMIHASNPKRGIIIGNAFASGGVSLQVIRRVC